MMSEMEVWLHGFAFPGRVAELARRAEEWGFTGLLVADSQNLTADIWVELALAVAATSRLRLGPGVTNPVTRDVAVSACAAATLQAESDGRATLGFAQGDSALSQIGRNRLSVAEFERQLQILQAFLRGEEVQLPERHVELDPLVARQHSPEGAGTRRGDRAPDDRGRRAARRRCRPHGRSRARAAALGRSHRAAGGPSRPQRRRLHQRRGRSRPTTEPASLSAAASRRSPGSPRKQAPLPGSRSRPATRLHGPPPATSRRAMARPVRHSPSSSTTTSSTDSPLAGPASEVRGRLAAIRACGIERLIVVPGSLDSEPEAIRQSLERFARDVLLELRHSPRAVTDTRAAA